MSYHVQADVGPDNFLEVKVRDRKFEVPFIVDLKEDWAEVKIKIFQQNKTSKYLPGGDRPRTSCQVHHEQTLALRRTPGGTASGGGAGDWDLRHYW